MTLGHIGYWAAVTVGLGCLVVVISLVVIRLHADADERRTRELRTPLWRVVLTLGAGEPDEVEAATDRLLSLSPDERAAIEDDTFALVPKLRGESRQRVREVLRAWGSVDQARNSTTSPSPVRRARGYYRLGVLALPERRDDVAGGAPRPRLHRPAYGDAGAGELPRARRDRADAAGRDRSSRGCATTSSPPSTRSAAPPPR